MPSDKKNKNKKSGPITRSSINNNKRKMKKSKNPSNKYKNDYPLESNSESESESEKDYDYKPSESDSDSDSLDESIDESESELLKENIKLKNKNKKRKINNSKKEEIYEEPEEVEEVKDVEFDYDEINLNNDEEYKKYLETIKENIKNMEDIIYNNVKNNNSKKEEIYEEPEEVEEVEEVEDIEFDYDEFNLNNEEEYKKYLETIKENIKNMEDTIYNNVKNNIDNKKGDNYNNYDDFLETNDENKDENFNNCNNCNNGDDCNNDDDCNNGDDFSESNNKNKKRSIGTILILSKSKESSDKLKKGYNLRVNTENNESLSIEDKKKIDETEKALFELNRYKIPPRHKVLLSSMTLASKAKIIENMERVENMNSCSSEYSKLTRWIDSILKVPFDKYYELPISITSPNKEIQSYLSNIESVMNKCIFSQSTAKEKILEFVGKWITNPSSTNEPIAFIGEKGTGKTTLAKEGIAKALGRPFFMISLGGESDAASFKGHDYTYEGSRWGRIVDILISTQCMNPVIFFDELDKLSTTRAGEEITGMLMHLTDTTQNDKFSDKYFSGIDFDLSKALFIFSYNDADKLNPILRDRLTEIQFVSFKKEDKLVIAKDFLINKACENIGLKINNFILEDNTIRNLIEKYTPIEESGVRSLKRIIETLFLRINLFQLPQDLNISYKNMKFKLKNGKYNITDDIISQLLKDIIPHMSSDILSMYM